MSTPGPARATSTDSISAPAGRIDPVLVAFTDRIDVAPALGELVEIFRALARASTLRTRLDGLAALSAWVRTPDPTMHWPAGEPDPARGRTAERRLGVLAMVLERSDDARAILGRAIESACVETTG